MLTTPTHSHKYGVNASTANSQAQADEPFASAWAKSRMIQNERKSCKTVLQHGRAIYYTWG
jgi:hypothetical protein